MVGLSVDDFGAKSADACERRAGVITSAQWTSTPPSAKRPLRVRFLGADHLPALLALVAACLALTGGCYGIAFLIPAPLGACRAGMEGVQFGARQTSGARRMKFAHWGDLHVLRDLKDDVVFPPG
jgi:hypothetical protein